MCSLLQKYPMQMNRLRVCCLLNIPRAYRKKKRKQNNLVLLGYLLSSLDVPRKLFARSVIIHVGDSRLEDLSDVLFATFPKDGCNSSKTDLDRGTGAVYSWKNNQRLLGICWLSQCFVLIETAFPFTISQLCSDPLCERKALEC